LGVPQWINPYGLSHSSQRWGQSQQSDRKLGFNEKGITPVFALDSREEGMGKQKCGGKGDAESNKLAQVCRGTGVASSTRIGSGVRVKNTKEIPTKVDVFDLSVQDVHCFIVNDGFVVKNSMDAVRYGMTNLRKKPETIYKIYGEKDEIRKSEDTFRTGYKKSYVFPRKS